MAGIPLTAGFIGKWAVFEVALSAGAWPVVLVGVLVSAAAAYFYVRVIVVMYFQEPDSESAYVAHPSALTATAIGISAAATLVLGHRARAGARPGAGCGTIHQVTDPSVRDALSSLAMPVPDEALARRLADRMAEVEQALAGHVRSRAPFVTSAASHLMEAGGKRFRPLLVLLAAETGSRPDSDDVITAACVVELTHLASLYHDDVMDEAALRRGAESANARWDNHVAILTGDFLFSKSSELTAELGADAVRIQAQTFTRLVEGQIQETVKPGAGDDPLEHYLDVVAGKTGSLIATSARYGARFGGATPEVEEALTAYGDIVGSAFQLSDDILDVASDSVESGKTPGHRPARGRADAARADGEGLDPARGLPAAPAARLRPQRRRPPRRGARPAPRAPGDGRGPRLRRGPRPGGQGAPQPSVPEGSVRDRPRELRRHRRHPLHLSPAPGRCQRSGTEQGEELVALAADLRQVRRVGEHEVGDAELLVLAQRRGDVLRRADQPGGARAAAAEPPGVV